MRNDAAKTGGTASGLMTYASSYGEEVLIHGDLESKNKLDDRTSLQ